METKENKRSRSVLERRKARIAEGRANPDLIPHGKPGTRTNWDCHCDPCRQADAERTRQRRLKVRMEQQRPIAAEPARRTSTYTFSMRPLTPA